MCSAPFRRALLTCAAVCVSGAAALALQRSSDVTRPTEPVVLATTAYMSDAGERTVTVWRRDVEGTPAAALDYLRKHPDRNALPNVLLYAVDAPFGTTAGARVVWVGYDFFASNMRPWPTWSADVVVHPATRQMYLALLKTMPLRGTVSLFEIPANASVAAFPPAFDPANADQWPEAPRPVATFQQEAKDQVCTPTSMRMAPATAGLLIAMVREPAASCPSVYVEFNTSSKTFREVTVSPR